MSPRRELVDYLLTKEASRGQEKTAFLVNLLKPINRSLKNEALISRIAPLGNRRILSEAGHFAGDFTLGGALGGGAAKLLGANPIEGAALGSIVTSPIGQLFNQRRANKYLDMALKGSKKLNKPQLEQLLAEMNPVATGIGSGGNLFELFGGEAARNRVRKSLQAMK